MDPWTHGPMDGGRVGGGGGGGRPTNININFKMSENGHRVLPAWHWGGSPPRRTEARRLLAALGVVS